MFEPSLTTVASGLRFPEGPIAMADGSVLLVEIARGTLSRVQADGTVAVVSELGGGPNGAAMGPDGHCYVCNNGGFAWTERGGKIYPGDQAADYSGGRIERVNVETGASEVLYTECDGHLLRGPNDLVFDGTGGFYFTDHGKNRARERDRTAIYYAKADGSEIRELLFPMEAPNGIGLSREDDELYIAETMTARVWAYEIESPGVLRRERRDKPDGGRLLPSGPGYYLYDSLAVDGAGNVCVATLMNGGISIISPRGEPARFVPMPDRMTTNICFGREGLRTAYVTLSSTGQLVSMEWETGGLPLHFLNR